MAGCAIPSTALPRALEGHELFSVADPVVAAQLGAPFLGRHRFLVRDGEARLTATLHARVVGPVTLAHLTLGGAADVVLQASAARVLVLEPVQEGTVVVQEGHASFEISPGEAAVIQRGRPVTLRSPGGSHRLVGIEERALLVHLGRLLGRGVDRPLVFDRRLLTGGAASTRWRLAVELLLAELFDRTSLLGSGIGSDQLEEFLMSSLLYGHGSSYTDALRQPDPAERRALTVARSFIEANLSDRLTLETVAASAGISVRTLQASFRSELRTTPTTYIKSRRLDRAHGDLCDIGAPVGTVTDVATRWGITHLGRFAAEYRSRYGESPSQTLRRQRR